MVRTLANCCWQQRARGSSCRRLKQGEVRLRRKFLKQFLFDFRFSQRNEGSRRQDEGDFRNDRVQHLRDSAASL
jgi:hypothetical protein